MSRPTLLGPQSQIHLQLLSALVANDALDHLLLRRRECLNFTATRAAHAGSQPDHALLHKSADGLLTAE